MEKGESAPPVRISFLYTNTRQVEAYSHYTPINHFAKVSKFHTEEYGEMRFSKYVRQ